jgi:hypothetical protein
VDAADLDEPGALLHRWFDEAGCDAVVVRPDRYVFGTAAGDAALTGLLGRLREALGAGVPARGPEVAG